MSLNTHNSRRDVLRKVGLAGSIVAVPGIAGALVHRAEAGPVPTTAPNPDLHLMRLERQFDHGVSVCREARRILDAAIAQARQVWPVVPKSIRLGGSPRRSWLYSGEEEEPYCLVSEGWGYEHGVRQAYTMRSVYNLRQLAPPSDGPPARLKSPKSIARYWRYRADSLAALADGKRFHAECQAIRERFRIKDLAAATTVAWNTLEPVVVEISKAQAQSFAGLAIKAKVLRDDDAKRASPVSIMIELPGSIADDILWLTSARAV